VKRLTALEALGRGLSNVRGNLEVVAAAAAGSVGILVLVVVSLIPWLGISILAPQRFAAGQRLGPDQIVAWLSRLASPRDLLAQLGLGLLALLVGLTAASVLYGWVWGGVLAVLHAGDAQAPPGSGRGAELFRIWSRKFFALEAARLTWKVLLFLSLFFALLLLVMLALFLLVVAAVVVGAKSGATTGLALGCGGLLPLLFVYFAVSGAMWIGQVELVRPEVSVTAATRAGFAVLGRRLGASVAIFGLFFLLACAAGLLFGGAAFLLRLSLASRPAIAATVDLALSLIQLTVSSALQVASAGAFVALARSEHAAAPAGESA
jgi:hypothetical protein